MTNELTECPLCGNPGRHIPAGVSRHTGKPYSEFWACKHCRNPKDFSRDLTWSTREGWSFLKNRPALRPFRPSGERITMDPTATRRGRRNRTPQSYSVDSGERDYGEKRQPLPRKLASPVTLDRFGNVLVPGEHP